MEVVAVTGGCESAHHGAFSGAAIGARSGLAIGSLSGNAGRVLGGERSNPSGHKNYSMRYNSHLSWSSPTTPTPLELYPALAFDHRFKAAAPGDKSVANAVLSDAQALRRGISAGDQRKLDEYLDSGREVEKRIENAVKRGERQG